MSAEEKNSTIHRVLIFGDDFGVPLSIEVVPRSLICAVVGAEIRPKQHSFLRSLSEELGKPFLIQPKYSSPDYHTFLDQVKDLAPDLIFVNSYSMLIRPDVLQIPRYGAINVHGALLPQYRGSNPIQWALLNDEQETGVTMHYMSEHFDLGDIIAQRRVPINFIDTWRDIQARIGLTTKKMLLEEMPNVLKGTNTSYKQDEKMANYYRRRLAIDGRFEWTSSVRYIYNLTRALVKPHPGAFYSSDAHEIILDEYLTIPQIVKLKYGIAGGQKIQSQNLALFPLNLEDVPKLEKSINAHLRESVDTPYYPICEGQVEEWFQSLQDHNEVIIFCIRHVKTEELIGYCQLQSFNPVQGTVELSYYIHAPSLDRFTCFVETVSLLLNFAFKDLNLHKVYSYISVNDDEKIKAGETIGFTREGLLRQALHINGVNTDILLMGIVQEEFYAG